ncbi:MAG: nuclear transport factor 2 family protein, partial [Lutibacter sp.]|nr:nuclear transport factor 2 family protein [Lutibacter sp.]
MKKIVLFAMVFTIALTSYSQKKKNGSVYVDHPSI